MCIKVGNNELSSVKGLMSMSLNAIFAEIFDKELEDLDRNLRLREDLGMTEAQGTELVETVAEYFDDLALDIDRMQTLGDVFDVVVEQAFEDIPAEAFEM